MANTGVTITLTLKDDATGGLQKFTGTVAGLNSAGTQAAGAIAATGRASTTAVAGTNALASSFKTMAFAAKAFIASRIAREVIGFGKSVVQAAMQQEDANAKLRASLLATGQLTDANVAKFQGLASARQLVTRYGDEATQSEIATAIAMGVSLDKIEALTVAAQDFASTFRMEFSSAFRMTSRAFMGDIEMLSRYGFRLDDTNIKRLQSMKVIGQVAEKQRDELIVQDKLNQATAFFTKFQGQSNAEAVTTAGSVAKMTNAWGDYKEELGRVITQSQGFVTAARSISGWLQQLKKDSETGPAGGGWLNTWMTSLGMVFHEARVERERAAKLRSAVTGGMGPQSGMFAPAFSSAVRMRELGLHGTVVGALSSQLMHPGADEARARQEVMAITNLGYGWGTPKEATGILSALDRLKSGKFSSSQLLNMEGLLGRSLGTEKERRAIVDEFVREVKRLHVAPVTVNVTIREEQTPKQIAEAVSKKLSEELDRWQQQRQAEMNPILGGVGGGR